jgi:dephospho-CoA kinase
VLLVGLTGGIGSGKTTFARMLEARGAEVIDADELGRQALEPGKPGWHSVVDQFGDEVLAAHSMEIDRKRLAAIVFSVPEKLAALNAIVHPVIMRGIADCLEALRDTDETVILDAALIVELGIRSSLDVLIVVEAPPDKRRDRLVRERGMDLADVERRIGSQADPETLRATADIIVTNDSTMSVLEAEAERVWKELQERKRSV